MYSELISKVSEFCNDLIEKVQTGEEVQRQSSAFNVRFGLTFYKCHSKPLSHAGLTIPQDNYTKPV